MTGAGVETPAVTQDALLAGRIRFDQPADGYRAAIDPVLLAAAVPARPGERVLDLGAGAGAASLCLAWRVADCRITGIEREAALVALANANAAVNGMERRVAFRVGDIAEAMADSGEGAFDHAIANPPYLEAGRADLRQRAGDDASERARRAEIEDETPLAVWLDRMCRAVRPKGRITLIQRVDRLDDILAVLRGRAGDIAVLPLWPRAGVPARRAIVSARPGTRAPMRLLPGLVLHSDDGAYTDAAAAILQDGAALDL